MTRKEVKSGLRERALEEVFVSRRQDDTTWVTCGQVDWRAPLQCRCGDCGRFPEDFDCVSLSRETRAMTEEAAMRGVRDEC